MPEAGAQVSAPEGRATPAPEPRSNSVLGACPECPHLPPYRWPNPSELREKHTALAGKSRGLWVPL